MFENAWMQEETPFRASVRAEIRRLMPSLAMMKTHEHISTRPNRRCNNMCATFQLIWYRYKEMPLSNRYNRERVRGWGEI
jgi:hypothetical protein